MAALAVSSIAFLISSKSADLDEGSISSIFILKFLLVTFSLLSVFNVWLMSCFCFW